jgi:hypothetical protein
LIQLSDWLSYPTNSSPAIRISYDAFKAEVAWSDGRLKLAEEFSYQANTEKSMLPDLLVSCLQALFRDGREAEAGPLTRQWRQAHQDAGTAYDIL